MSDFETLLYDVADGVATVTLNRPDKYNAFNETMLDELSGLWHRLRSDDDVRCVILTAAGDKAFCTGIDREEALSDEEEEFSYEPYAWDDPGERLGPKSCGLWKPVIAAVNGMACGGAFYMLGEVEFIIAADHATFFDPHVTYGMPAIYEPLLMSYRMPYGEVMRMTLLGTHEQITAERAHQIGLVSEVAPGDDLMERARWAATAIASQPSVPVQATVKTIWATRELTRRQALEVAPQLLSAGLAAEHIAEGQRTFSSGQRIVPRRR